MPSLNLDLDFFDHQKTKRLSFQLGAGSELCLLRLWTYCGRFHPIDGRFKGHTDQEIESIAQWSGKKGKMLQACKTIGWMDKDGDDWFMVGWMEHQGHLAAFKLRAKDAAVTRWEKCRAEKQMLEALLKHTDSNALTNSSKPTLPNQLPILTEEQLIGKCNVILGMTTMLQFGTVWKERAKSNPARLKAILDAMDGKKLKNKGGYANELWEKAV